MIFHGWEKNLKRAELQKHLRKKLRAKISAKVCDLKRH